MININLRVKPPPIINWRRTAMLAAAGAALLGAAAYAVTWWVDYRDIAADRAGAAQLAAEYRRVIARSEAIKKREDEVKKQQEQIALITRNQAPTGQSEVLGAIFGAEPGTVAVTEVAVGKGGEIILSGQAATFDAAMAFLGTLRGVPTLEGVQERKLNSAADGRTSFTFAVKVRWGVRR